MGSGSMDEGRTVKQSVVLVVEDDPFQRKSMERILSAAGFTVLVTGRAEKALAVLDARDDIAAVVTDIKMPVPYAAQGFTAGILLRRNRPNRPLHVRDFCSGVLTHTTFEDGEGRPS